MKYTEKEQELRDEIDRLEFQSDTKKSELVDLFDSILMEKNEEIGILRDKLRHYPILASIIESGNKEIAELKAKVAELTGGRS